MDGLQSLAAIFTIIVALIAIYEFFLKRRSPKAPVSPEVPVIGTERDYLASNEAINNADKNFYKNIISKYSTNSGDFFYVYTNMDRYALKGAC